MGKKATHGGARPGAGRPDSGRRQVTLMLSIETLEKLERSAPTRLEQAAIIDYLVRRSKKLTTCDPDAISPHTS